jgi:hypothetical protein
MRASTTWCHRRVNPVVTDAKTLADPLLQAVAQAKVQGAEITTFEPIVRPEDGKQVWPLHFWGTTAQGARFDVMFEFLSLPDRTAFELVKRTLMDVCLEASNAIEKGVL